MHKNGWRPFWAALGAALLVLLPLVGGTVLLTRQMVRTRIQTAQPQSGVPIQLPRAEHRMTLLLCTAGEQPGFLLVYLNAAQNSLNLLAVPGELTVPFNEETAGLAHCYGAAGPARCRQALLEVLGLPEDMLYLALSPAVLEKTASRYGPVRVGFSGALTADELTRTGLSAAVQSISAKEAHALLSGIIAKVGAIAAIRVIYFTVGAEALRGTWVQTVCIVLTLVTIFMGSFMGCTENGLKKRLAYSSISQISYVLLGVFLMTPVGLLGGLLQLLFHALAKIGVFQSAGSIIFLTGTETIDGFPGLGRRIPVTMGCFAALALSLVGIPPFGGFFSKWYLALGALGGMSAPLCYIIPAVLLISADLAEVMELSDSLIVMHGGKIAAYLEDTSTLTDDVMGEYMLGLKHQSDEEIRRVCHD